MTRMSKQPIQFESFLVVIALNEYLGFYAVKELKTMFSINNRNNKLNDLSHNSIMQLYY